MSNIQLLIPYPNCLNGNQAKSVCLHEKCQMVPFFCSTCDEEKCQLKHQHSNKITSISFREFIRHVQNLKRPFPDLVEACNTYSKTLLDFQSKVYAFVLKQLKQIQMMKSKPPTLPQKQDQIVMRILNKQYTDLRGKDTDMIWLLRPSKPTQDIGYIQSKTEQIQSLSQDFKKLIAILNQNQQQEVQIQNINVKSDSFELIKIQQQNRNLQKLLQQRQQQVSNLQQSVTNLNKQNQQLILSRDQIMSEYLKKAKPQDLPIVQSAKQDDGGLFVAGMKKLEQENEQNKELSRPKQSQRSQPIPQHKGGRI